MPTKTESYRVQDGRDVLLEVTIGDGQQGSTTVFLERTKLADGSHIRKQRVGVGQELRGHKLVVSSVVLDVRPETNWTSVSVELSGGVGSKLLVQKAQAESHGTVPYLFVLRFE